METLPEPVGLGLVQQPSPVNVANDIPTNLTPAQPFSIHALLASEPYDPCALLEGEHYWRDRFLWLKEHGYTLRPRYSPDWKPSWVGTNKNRMDCEDSCLAPGRGHVLDATRISDGSVVVLKKISRKVHPYEAEIGQFLSSGPLASDPSNHCIPLIDVLQDPEDGDIQLLVMPMLQMCITPSFRTVGEALEFFRQAFEGLHFMHRHNVAHRDAMILNIMMDPKPMWPELFHFTYSGYNREYTKPVKPFSRTERPPKYYWTDFGLSRRYDPEAGPRRELPILGGDQTVPEHQGSLYDEPCDPMPTDVYFVANLIREYFLDKYTNLEFMRKLIDDMLRANPDERPTMDEVVERFAKIQKRLHWWNVRARLVRRSEWYIVRPVLGVAHVVRTARYILKGFSAVPVPSP